MEATENTQTKRCTKCGRELPVSEFGRNHAVKDGYDRYCRSCRSIMSKESRERIKTSKAKESGIYPANFFDRNTAGGATRYSRTSPQGPSWRN